jgi:hypothetical protein
LAFAFLLASTFILGFLVGGRTWFVQPRFTWWFIGVAVGIVPLLWLIDIDQMARYRQIEVARSIPKLPLLHYKLNLLRMALNAFDRLHPPGMTYWALACLWSGTAWMVRRYRQVSLADRNLLLILFSTFTGFAVINPSHTSVYIVYVLPWFCLLTARALVLMVRSKGTFDALDAAVSLMMLFVASYQSGPPNLAVCLLTPLVLWFIWRLCRRRTALPIPGWLAISIPWIGLFVAVQTLFLAFDHLVAAGYVVRLWLYARPWRVVALIVGIILLFLLRGEARVRWGIPKGLHVRPERMAAAVLLVGLCIGFAQTQRDVWRSIRLVALERSNLEALRPFRRERRMIGPPGFWMEEPSASVQNVEILFYSKAYGFNWNPLRHMLEYRPTMILWREEWMPFLKKKALEMRHPPRIVELRRFPSIEGDLIEIGLIPFPSAVAPRATEAS